MALEAVELPQLRRRLLGAAGPPGEILISFIMIISAEIEAAARSSTSVVIEARAAAAALNARTRRPRGVSSRTCSVRSVDVAFPKRTEPIRIVARAGETG